MTNYRIVSNREFLYFLRPDGTKGQVKAGIFVDALEEFEKVIQIFEDVEIPIGEILGLRNLSAFVGEVYNRAVKKVSGHLIQNNPHQDGYPDLLIMDKIGRDAWGTVASQLHEKAPFSPFPTGGIEVKATCGDLKTGKWFTKQNISKPVIGQQRLQWVTGYNWKAHHRETNNLMGLIWDFIQEKPTIVALMYSEFLEEGDWGKTVTPKVGGGRTTSVSIMNKGGISKMYKGLICMIDEDVYVEPMLKRLCKY